MTFYVGFNIGFVINKFGEKGYKNLFFYFYINGNRIRKGNNILVIYT
jgi:hypothetical protein